MNNRKTNSNLKKWWKTNKDSILDIIFCFVLGSLFGLLIISTNQKWPESWQIVIMVLILVCSFVVVIFPLFKKEKATISELIVVGICVLLLLASVIIFASVATGVYRDPIIQISASFTGGLMTLYGVGLTVKYNRLAKEKDDVNKAKPNIFPVGQQTWKSLSGTMKLERDIEPQPNLSSLKAVKNSANLYSFAPIYLANSDLSMCTFKGIIINGKHYIVFMYDVVFLKGSANCFKLNYCFEFKETIESIQLVVDDMIGNTYCCFVSFDLGIKNKNKASQISINGVLEIISADKNLPDVFQK